MNSKCEALLPCPFCGCDVILDEVPVHDEPELFCDNCNAMNTRDFWNRRAPVPTPRAQMDGAHTAATPETEVLRDAIDMLRAFQSTFGSHRPDADEQDDREAWDAIDRICDALSTPVVPDETGSDKARTADHAEEPGLDLSSFDGHTPGPWVIEDSDEDSCSVVNRECEADGWDIAEVYIHSGNSANARLIAAAPLLLAELRHLRDVRALLKELHKGEPQP